ncbi:MAG: TIGR01777 family oxidoreductase [Flavobacteriaceae bacterium]|jgi:uncharacterized protein (TIGR01777 family)
MKLLITGATGLIGKKILAKAIKNNITVHYLSTRKHKLKVADGVKGFYWNPEEDEIDGRCFQGVDTLIHLAGASISMPWTSKNKKRIMDSRVDSTRLLKREIKQQKIKLKNIVCASAIGIYPNSLVTEYDENSSLEPKNFLQQVTMAWEEESQSLSSFTEQLSILRIGLVLSGDGGLLSKLALPVKFFSGAAFASGKQWQSWIHIEDLSNLFFTAVDQNWSGVFNAVAPNPVTQKSLIKGIGKVLGRPVFLPNIPAVLLKTLMGERSVLILGSQKISADLIVAKGFSFQYEFLDNALQDVLSKKE